MQVVQEGSGGGETACVSVSQGGGAGKACLSVRTQLRQGNRGWSQVVEVARLLVSL